MEELNTVKDLSHLELLIAAALFLAGLYIHPLSTLKERTYEVDSASLRIFLIPIGLLLYLLLHEFTHVLFMKHFGADKIVVTQAGGLTATGSPCYYDKFSFCIVTLAPAVIWGTVLIIAMLLVPVRWFWVFYAMLILNFSSSSSDFFAVYHAFKASSGSLVQDTGLEIAIYSKRQNDFSEV